MKCELDWRDRERDCSMSWTGETEQTVSQIKDWQRDWSVSWTYERQGEKAECMPNKKNKDRGRRVQSVFVCVCVCAHTYVCV